jgi:hypothetical protein
MHTRSFRISGVRAYDFGLPTMDGAGHGGRRKYHPGFSVICCYGVLACISGSAENHIPLKRWLQGCLSCGVTVGIRSSYLGLREFSRLLAIWSGSLSFGIWWQHMLYRATGMVQLFRFWVAIYRSGTTG